MAMTSAPTDRIDEIGALLVNCGSTKFGSNNLSNNDSPPRYVWIPTDDDYESEASVEFGALELGLQGAFAQQFTVEVWGTDYATTWRLRAALITAIRQVMARAYRIGGAEWINGGPDQRGWKCLQIVTLFIPLLDQDLPEQPGGAITDSGTLTARATSVLRVTTHFDD